MEKDQRLRVVELFAGVGGFRVGLERASSRFQTVWADQWEPGQKGQWAYRCYCQNFGEAARCCNQDIAAVLDQVPEHDLLVGGFPCQDYSVARTGARGIEGKKGVLWWSIDAVIRDRRPPFVLLENVDRLLRSPARQRGRDFGVILRCLADAGYLAEWRVINAADYGCPQRRRRTFLFAARRDALPHAPLEEDFAHAAPDWILSGGFFAPAFPVRREGEPRGAWADLRGYADLVEVTEGFAADFYQAGTMLDGLAYSEALEPVRAPEVPLSAVVEAGAEGYDIPDAALEKWTYLKGSKRIERTSKSGHSYLFSEGAIPFPDPLDRPSRTMLTSESALNRSTHVIQDPATGRLRKLSPVECERLNGFPDGWTDTGMPQRQRYFIMGNALVVPLITQMGRRLLELLGEDPS